MLRPLFCLFGRHRRSRRQTLHFPDGTARSLCRGCGKRMLRDDAGSWRIVATET